MCIACGKYDKRWRWCYCDFLALLLGGGFAVISVGDMLSRCSFIMYLSFSTGRLVEETVQ